jgi:hypothetical protein
MPSAEAAPGSGQGDAALRGHEHGVGRDEGVLAHVVLVHPQQAVAPQRGHVLPHEWLGTGVARLGEQYRAQTGGQIGRACGTLGQMREGFHAAGARRDLQQDLRQVDARHACLDLVAQCDK